MSQNPNELAGATQPHSAAPPPDEAREVFPIRFEKDYLDFTGKPEAEEGTLVPKSSSAPASVEQPKSVTGLEDLSGDELENPVLPDAERDKNQTTGTAPESGSQTSSKGTSAGKSAPPASP